MYHLVMLIITILIGVTAIYAQTVRQFLANNASLDMRYSSGLQRLYIQYDAQISKSEVG
ncbi:MAG: hypothetical protein GX294_05870 [Candidatus Cloacimonetes bacterium]|nr:hypothetical protein [Candidatus Cloacimonadota bacterium]